MDTTGQLPGIDNRHTSPETLLAAYGLTTDLLDEARSTLPGVNVSTEDLVRDFYSWLEGQPVFDEFFSDRGTLDKVKARQVEYWKRFLEFSVDEAYVVGRRHIGDLHAQIGLAASDYLEGQNFCVHWLSSIIEESSLDASARARLSETITRLGNFDQALVLQAYHDSYFRRGTELALAQSQMITELSTPVIRLYDEILLLPLVGTIDTLRAAQLLEVLLAGIVETQSRVAILDITGVPIIDTQVAQHLIKTVYAAKMLGAEVIMSGLSPATAQTLVQLGVEMRDINTRGTLQKALAYAFGVLGMKIVAREGTSS